MISECWSDKTLNLKMDFCHLGTKFSHNLWHALKKKKNPRQYLVKGAMWSFYDQVSVFYLYSTLITHHADVS